MATESTQPCPPVESLHRAKNEQEVMKNSTSDPSNMGLALALPLSTQSPAHFIITPCDDSTDALTGASAKCIEVKAKAIAMPMTPDRLLIPTLASKRRSDATLLELINSYSRDTYSMSNPPSTPDLEYFGSTSGSDRCTESSSPRTLSGETMMPRTPSESATKHAFATPNGKSGQRYPRSAFSPTTPPTTGASDRHRRHLDVMSKRRRAAYPSPETTPPIPPIPPMSKIPLQLATFQRPPRSSSLPGNNSMSATSSTPPSVMQRPRPLPRKTDGERQPPPRFAISPVVKSVASRDSRVVRTSSATASTAESKTKTMTTTAATATTPTPKVSGLRTPKSLEPSPSQRPLTNKSSSSSTFSSPLSVASTWSASPSSLSAKPLLASDHQHRHHHHPSCRPSTTSTTTSSITPGTTGLGPARYRNFPSASQKPPPPPYTTDGEALVSSFDDDDSDSDDAASDTGRSTTARAGDERFGLVGAVRRRFSRSRIGLGLVGVEGLGRRSSSGSETSRSSGNCDSGSSGEGRRGSRKWAKARVLRACACGGREESYLS